jgi:hypothetical protein
MSEFDPEGRQGTVLLNRSNCTKALISHPRFLSASVSPAMSAFRDLPDRTVRTAAA